MGLFSSEISTKNMMPLCRQLGSAYEAGIPIVRALEVVREQTSDRTVRGVLERMQANIKQGESLGDAARAERRYLPPFFIALLSSGERGGRLDVMLRDLSSYFEDRLRLQRAVVSALVYPAFQLSAAWFIGSFALTLVGQLDLASTTAFNFEKFLAGYLLFQAGFLGLLGVTLIAAVIFARVGMLRYITGWAAYYIWPFRNVGRKFALARFFRSMSLLIGSGMHIKHCIIESAAVSLNPYVERDLLRAVPAVSEGATLTQAFGAARCLTPVSREMLAIGEQSGRLEESCRKVSEYHLEEADHAVQVVTKVLGLVALLFVAGIIGYVVITFYSNLYGKMFSVL